MYRRPFLAHRMANIEQKPLLVVEDPDYDDGYPAHPPPAYEPSKKEPAQTSPTYATALPLPTYEQSEKYEREGVLELDHKDTHGSSEDYESVTYHDQRRGTCCEFIVFFMICAVFGVVGFVFSFCLATTVAAQSGAMTGLGMVFLSQPIVFEMYDDGLKEPWRENYCNSHWGFESQQSVDDCIRRAYLGMRVFFWVIGLIGLIMFYKGLSSFCRSRRCSADDDED